MEAPFLIPLLMFGTLIAVIVFAIISKKRTVEKLKDPEAPKSTLAADAPDKRES